MLVCTMYIGQIYRKKIQQIAPKKSADFGAAFTKYRLPYWCFNLCSIFQKNGGNNRKLENVQKLVQHFSEQYRLPKLNKILLVSIFESLR